MQRTTEAEWKARAAAQFRKRLPDLADADVLAAVDAAYSAVCDAGDLDFMTPEEQVDEELTYWDNDEGGAA